MKTFLINVATLGLLPVWFVFTYFTLRGAGSHMDGHSVGDFVGGVAAIAIPAGTAAAYYHFGWRFFGIGTTASTILIGLPAILGALVGGIMFRSLLPERCVPTKVSLMVQSKFAPAAPVPHNVDRVAGVSYKPVQVMEYSGRPPESVLYRSKNQ